MYTRRYSNKYNRNKQINEEKRRNMEKETRIALALATSRSARLTPRKAGYYLI
jgi:hypothetical protein